VAGILVNAAGLFGPLQDVDRRSRGDRQQRPGVTAVVAGRGVDEGPAAGLPEALELREAAVGIVEDVVRVFRRAPGRRAGQHVLVDVRETELIGADRPSQRLDHAAVLPEWDRRE
jgi:hypothetical protein